MPGLEVVEEHARRPGLSFFRVLQPLTDSLPRVGACSDIEKALIGFRILDHGSGLAFYGKHDGSLAFL